MLRRSVWGTAVIVALAALAVCGAVWAAAGAAVWPQVIALPTGLLAGIIAAAISSRIVEKRAEICMNRTVLALGRLHQGTLDTTHTVLPDMFLPGQKPLLELIEQIFLESERTRLERARADNMLNNMNEGLVALDSELTIVVMNKCAGEFFKASSDDMLGQNLLHLTHLPRLIEAATQTAATGNGSTFDWDDTSSGLTLQISVSAVGGIADSGSNGVVLLITDVTTVRRTEQIRSEFVANASHELKTPLTAIKGFVELMETDIISEPDQVKGYLGRIRQETQRMIELINDILRLSELESVNADTGFTAVSMKLTAQRAAESVALSAQKRDIHIEVDGDVGTVRANPDRMMQLALNLIDNAVKYNKPGGSVRVAVTTQGDTVSFRVQDTGVGIPPEAKERVFERFYRVDKGRSRRQGGTGLGLSIVKHITGLYKGHIDIDSTVGEGTSITVTLPANL